jgi:hypothetical protein
MINLKFQFKEVMALSLAFAEIDAGGVEVVF